MIRERRRMTAMGFNPQATYDERVLWEMFDCTATDALPTINGAVNLKHARDGRTPNGSMRPCSCEYPLLSYLNCEGGCLNDSDGNCVRIQMPMPMAFVTMWMTALA